MSKRKRFQSQPSKQMVEYDSCASKKKQNEVLQPVFSKQTRNFFKKKPSTIILPVPTQQEQKNCLSKNTAKLKPFPDRLIPPRNNLRCLNDFLKQQVFFIKNKQRIVSNISSKQISNSTLDVMKEKIINMIKLQTTQSQILLQQNSLECFNDVHIQNLELDCQPLGEQPTKEKLKKAKGKSSIAKRPTDSKVKKDRPKSLTPLFCSPLISKNGSNQKLSEGQNLKFITIRHSSLGKDRSLLKTNQQSQLFCKKIDINFQENFK